MNEMTINFNGQDYIAEYNEQTGYYEVNLEAPQQGGIYGADIAFTDLLGQSYEDTQVIQIWAKEKIKVETNKVFMWIFDYKDFEVKDIIELSDYDINIDEETNANSIIKVLKKTTAKSRDIVMIKKNNEVIYWGIVDNIQNEDSKALYEYTLKYITNMFDEKVALAKNVTEIEEGTYVIKSALDATKVLDIIGQSTENEGNVQIWGNNNTVAQKFNVIKQNDGTYKIQNTNSEKYLTVQAGNYQNSTNVFQYSNLGNDQQKFEIIRTSDGYFRIRCAGNSNYSIDVAGGNVAEGTNVQIYNNNTTPAQKWIFQKLEEETIKNEGIEDFIAKAINDNFVNSEDTLTNRQYLDIRVKTHTKLQTTVSNTEDNLYNLHTWMSNCTQLYNIKFTFYIENKKLVIEIENKSLDKELIDVNAQPISGYTEVFDTDIVSKVEVSTNTHTYYLYLLNDRTTTTDATNENRAEGRTERVFTANYEDAEQKALDQITANKYNHNVTFKYFDRYIELGTPITIKTKESLIYDTYISAIKITQEKFVEYICGNIRTNFIDKLKKERRNK